MFGLVGILILHTLMNSLLADLNFIEEPISVSIKVGEMVSFLCEYTGTSEIPYWVINDTFYNWRAIDRDYALVSTKDGYSLQIPQVKLWMDNTRIRCEFLDEDMSSNTAILSVIFDFGDPADTVADNGGSAFINCSSPLIANLSIIWNINGLYYIPIVLPLAYKIEENGLRILRVQDSMNGSTFQCLFQSSLLLLSGYYRSKVGVLTVNHIDVSYIEPNNRMDITYSDNYFRFDDSTVTIYWDASGTDCNEDSQYYLVKLFDGTVINKTALSSSNHTAIQKSDLEIPNTNTLYQYYVEARNQDGILCGRSVNTIQIPSSVLLVEINILPGKNVCIHIPGIVSCVAIWFGEDLLECKCPCGVVEFCNCQDDHVFNNGSRNQICWDRDGLQNGTQIYFTTENRNNSYTPQENILYIQAYKIIIADLPGIPTISVENNSVICLTDNYSGNNPIEEYNVTVGDITGLSGTFIIFPASGGNTTCDLIPSYFRSDPCSILFLTASSKNSVGYSEPSPETIIELEGDENICNCFYKNVNVYMTSLNRTLPHAIELFVDCSTKVYNNIESVNLTAKVSRALKYKDSVVYSSKTVQCGQIAKIDKLESDSTYLVLLSWDPVKDVIKCPLKRVESFVTEKGQSIEVLHIVIAVLSVIIFIVFCIIIIVILCYILYHR